MPIRETTDRNTKPWRAPVVKARYGQSEAKQDGQETRIV
jgi:hypothetical protein